jgi:gliding-associated putative ABC transporter substrate-binding component GldG
MRALKKIFASAFGLPLIILLLMGINIFTSFWHARFDLTNEKRFTLSKGTKSILKSIDQPLVIDVFLKGNYPSGFRQLSSGTEDLLREFKEIVGSNLEYHFIAPEDLVEGSNSVTYGDTLEAMGLEPIPLTAQLKDGQKQQNIYPFAMIHYKDREALVELYKVKNIVIDDAKGSKINNKQLNDAEAMLEYNFADAIDKIQQDHLGKVGYAIGNGEPTDISVYDLAEETLRPNYDLSLINLKSQPLINPEFKALIILKPNEGFSESEKLKIDQYVMNGGKVLFFVDRLNAEMDSLQLKNQVVAYDRGLNLEDLLFKYGVRIRPNLLLDLQCDYLPFDVSGNGQFEFIPWNYFPVLESSNNHPINKNLGFISSRFVNSIDTIESQEIKKTVLLQSSENSRLLGSPAIISGKKNSVAPQDESFHGGHVPVAVLLEGKFSSLFANHLTNDLKDSLSISKRNYLTACSNDNKILVVSDGDILMNSVIKGDQPLPMGMNPFTYGTKRQFPFSNKEFLTNALDYMINDNGLSEVKNKEYKVRLLDMKRIRATKLNWQLFNILLPVSLVLLFAFIFQWLRKRKFSL